MSEATKKVVSTEITGESVLTTLDVAIASSLQEETVTKTDKTELEQKPAVQLVERNGAIRIAINSNDVRRFIWNQMDDQMLINQHYIHQDQDDDVVKQAKDRQSIWMIEHAVQQWGDWFDEYGIKDGVINHELVFSNLYERYEPIANDIVQLGNLLIEQRTRLVAESTEALNGEPINYSRLFFALKQKGLTLCVRREDDNIAGVITGVAIEPASIFRSGFIKVQMKIYTHNGVTLVPANYNHIIPEYSGDRSINDLGVITLTDEIKQSLIERGRKYLQYTQKPSYLSYTGEVVRRSYWANSTFRAAGRIMVDLLAMKSIDSNYNYYFAMDRGRDNDRDNKLSLDVSDEVLMSTSPYVYGFSFSAKVWGEMRVEEMSEITFREDAFDKLVLPSDIKNMLASLVESNQIIGKDFIDGKGGGCIFLLAGSPGVGKTLSAEAIAEKLKKPLYMVGIGELGTNVQELEASLRDILDIAASWDAVLLLDEADIFMEARDDVNIERNAMVGVFLRMLEYYQGTLFLTTNRAKSIDEAFYSRISLAIKYEDLDLASRRIIWTNILSLYGLSNIDVEMLAHHVINGRQIKNVTRIVTSLANTSGASPTTEDFIKVIDHVTKFNMSN